jgi:Protein of unknown function (DUF2911)
MHYLPMTFRKTVESLSAVLFMAFAAGCTTGSGPAAPEINFDPSATRTLVTTLGTDTLTVEVYTRTENEVSGVVVERNPSTTLTRFAAMIAADGTIRDMSAERIVPDPEKSHEVLLSWTVDFSDGKATLTREGGQNPGTFTMNSPRGTIPTLGRASTAGFVFEQVARQLSGVGSDDGEIWLLGPTSTAPRINASLVISADSVSMDAFGSPRVGWFGDGRQLIGASGQATTMKGETWRSLPLNADSLASRWAAMDALGKGIGTPSPRAEVSASVAGTNIEIVYSRPAMRGRDIWGGLVPYDEVWRTGANAATQFSTSRDLIVGGKSVPVGTYSLFSIFTPESQTLIINSQTGQWGTQYDAGQDFARISMSKSRAPEFTERFTISVEPDGKGGVLNLDWDTTRFSVPFEVR